MDSYLSNRPKMDSTAGFDAGMPADGLAYRDPMEGHDAFMASLPQTGGFQSLKTALMEAGSVMSASDLQRSNHAKGALAEGQTAEPSVELITHEGRIEKVIVTCSCCRTIELDCTY
jgi:hypothetical protein